MRDFDGLEAILVIYALPAMTFSILIACVLLGVAFLLNGAPGLRIMGLCLLLLAGGGAFAVYRWTQSTPPPGASIYTPHYMVRWSYVQWKTRQQAIDLMRGSKPWEQPDSPAQDDGPVDSMR
jgi:hypothetical protein